MIPTEAGQTQPVFPLKFALPRGFQPIDLAEPPDRRADRLYDRLAGLTPEERLHVVLANQYMIERMVDEGVIYAASFVGRSEVDPTAATTAQFTVLLKDAADRRGRPLEAILDALRQERKNCAAQLVDLPIGRCLLVVEDDRFSTSTDILGRHESRNHHVRQIQVIYPLTDRGELALFGLSTECLRDWDDYVAMMAEICKTITWMEGDENTSIGAVLGG